MRVDREERLASCVDFSLNRSLLRAVIFNDRTISFLFEVIRRPFSNTADSYRTAGMRDDKIAVGMNGADQILPFRAVSVAASRRNNRALMFPPSAPEK